MLTLLKQHQAKKLKSEEGFTLIELIVVIVIIGILSAIVVFALRGSTDTAKVAKCKQNGSTMIAALDSYYSATGVFPPATGATVTSGNYSNSAITKKYVAGDFGAMVPDYLRSAPTLDDIDVYYTPARSFTVSAGTATATDITLTVAAAASDNSGGSLKVGDLITVTGLTSALWNVTSAKLTTVTSATSVTFPNLYGITAGSISGQSGSLTVAPRVAVAGLVSGCGDFGK